MTDRLATRLRFDVRSRSDAQLLSNLKPIPALVWAVPWTAMALTILFIGARMALRKGRSL